MPLRHATPFALLERHGIRPSLPPFSCTASGSRSPCARDSAPSFKEARNHNDRTGIPFQSCGGLVRPRACHTFPAHARALPCDSPRLRLGTAPGPRSTQNRRSVPGCRRREGDALRFVPGSLLTPELCLAAVRNECLLCLVPEDRRSADLCLAAVQADQFALKSVPRELRTPKLYLAAVQSFGCALKYVPEEFKTEALCAEAVRQHPASLEHMPEALLTATFCWEAVRLDGNASPICRCLCARASSARRPWQFRVGQAGGGAQGFGDRGHVPCGRPARRQESLRHPRLPEDGRRLRSCGSQRLL